jgi:NAD(P)-dependent dehydrogenase (short-subunit alcohol dehydrogenase family)
MTQKTVLVTGAAQGIGRATARLLAQRGYAVAVADVNPRAGRQVGLPFFACDVSREPSVRACVRATLRRFGRLDARARCNPNRIARLMRRRRAAWWR